MQGCLNPVFSLLFASENMARKYLVVGNGGREHALVWKLASSLGAEDVIYTSHPSAAASVAPCKLVFCPAKTVDELVSFAQEQGVSLVVVGPEGPLAEGITGEWS